MENQNNNVLNWEETFAKLAEPFSPEEVGWRIGHTFQHNNVLKGIAMPYATNRAIQKRLDETFGIFGWKNEYKEWLNGSQLCGISVRVIYEDGKSEWVTKWDGAECTDFEPIKGGLSDSMKRCAFQWSIGRYLYDIDTQYVEVEEKGKNKTIGKKEKERLKAFLSGKQLITPVIKQQQQQKNSKDAQQDTDKKNNNPNENGNSKANPNVTLNATQNKQGAATGTSGNTTPNANTNTNTNKPTTTGNGNGEVSGGKVSPKQAGFIKSLLLKSNTAIDDTLAKYGVEALEELSKGQASEVINNLMSIAS